MYRFFQLENGIQVALFQMDGVKSVTLKTMLTGGPVVEDDFTSGASHFLEHIVLGGTKNYPTKLEFATYLEDLGISYGGYTSIGEIAFDFDIPFTNTYKMLDLLQEILFAPSFSDENIEKERTVILEEMQDRENSPDFQFYRAYSELRFQSPTHALARRIAGTPEVIGGITKEKLIDLYNRIFIPSNIYICLVGNFDTEEMKTYMEENFSGYKSQHIFQKQTYSPTDLSGYVVRAFKDEKFTNVYTNISFPAYAREIPVKVELAMRIFSIMFGGLRTSWLFQDVREKAGLVYNIYADWAAYAGLGTFSIAFESDKSKLERILEIVFTDIQKALSVGFSDKELDHVKNYINNRTLLAFSTPAKIAAWLMDYVFNDEEVIFPENIIDIASSVTHDDVHKALVDSFDESKMNAIFMGKLNGFNAEKIIASNLRSDMKTRASVSSQAERKNTSH